MLYVSRRRRRCCWAYHLTYVDDDVEHARAQQAMEITSIHLDHNFHHCTTKS